MPCRQASGVYSNSSSTESRAHIAPITSQLETSNIASKPGFQVFTSLLWIRRSEHLDKSNASQPSSPPSSNHPPSLQYITLDDSKPDLGLLEYHQHRLAVAAGTLRWPLLRALEKSTFGLGILRCSIAVYLRCLPKVPPGYIEQRKLRILINKKGVVSIDSTIIDCVRDTNDRMLANKFSPISLDLNITSAPTLQLNGGLLHDANVSQVHLDSQSTHPSLFTTLKTSYRPQYNFARTRAKVFSSPPTEKEVLLYNTYGEVMEASLCTVYIFRDGQWITPAAICGPTMGVTRRIALENGICRQGRVNIIDLVDGETIWLSNAARGFFIGQICLHQPTRPNTPLSGAAKIW